MNVQFSGIMPREVRNVRESAAMGYPDRFYQIVLDNLKPVQEFDFNLVQKSNQAIISNSISKVNVSKELSIVDRLEAAMPEIHLREKESENNLEREV